MNATQSHAVQLHQNVPPDWYAKSIKENLLQRFWHNRRFREIAKLIPAAGGRILDIGSADGTFTKVILTHSRAMRVVGIDVLESSVSFAKRRFARSKQLKFRVADAHDLPFENKEFDAVFCLETLEHVEDPDRVIAEIRRVLKDNGYVVILIPSENILFRLGWPVWLATRGKIWKGTHLHQFTADQIIDRLVNGGFKIDKNHKFILGMLQAVKAVKNKK